MRNELNKAAERAVTLLKKGGLKLASAESCTSGLIPSAITAVSGASEVFELSVCSYSNRIKNEILGVPKEILSRYSAISLQTAAYMAKGVFNLSGADFALSTTGAAGPEGSCERRAGFVIICLYDGSRFWLKELELYNLKEREQVRLAAAREALELLIKRCEEGKDFPNYIESIEAL